MHQLEQIEAIRQMKYRYFRALDTRQWDLMATVLHPDCEANYDSGKYHYQGRDAILDFFKSYMNGPNKITVHQAHHPEITLIDDNNATGTWYLQDIVIDLDENWTLRGAGFYVDRYLRTDEGWTHIAVGYNRVYEETETRNDAMTINNNMFTRPDGHLTGKV